MLVSHQAKFIFVHVQKTAGLSFESVLRENFPDLQQWHGRHGMACDGMAEWGRERWHTYYSFAFVRNPWDRLVSWYSMIDRERRSLPFYRKWQSSPFKREIWNQVVQKGRTFDEFIERCTDVVFDSGCNKSFAFNQIDYLTGDRNEIAVSKIGRFETLREDAAEIFARLGIDAVLPRRNRSSHDHYSKWYTEHTRAVVAERFARDIAQFGYAFEQC